VFHLGPSKQVIIQTVSLWFHGADNEDHKICGHLLTFFDHMMQKHRFNFNATAYNREQYQASADTLHYLDSSESCNPGCQSSPIIPFKEGNHITTTAAPHATQSTGFIVKR